MKKRIFVITVLFVSALLLYNLFSSNEIYLKKNQQVVNCKDCIVQNEETAIRIAEDRLFMMYGKNKIKDERPYNIALIKNKLWVMTGSLNHGLLYKLLSKYIPVFGGVFEIKINAKDGKIIDVTHYK